MGYQKQIYDRAWEQLELRRQQAGERESARRAEIALRIPGIAEIERNMAACAASVTKAVIAQPQKAQELVRQIAGESLSLQRQRSDLLELNGYPRDYLDPQYGCTLCHDRGYVGRDRCGCLNRLLEAEAHAQLSAAAPMEACTFANFSLSWYADAPVDGSGVVPAVRMGEVCGFMKQYAAGFSPASESLLLMGHTGLGKTHLSLAVAGEVLAAGFGVIYSPVQRLLDRLEHEKFSRDEQIREGYMEHIRQALECDLLVLDDLGAEFSTAFTKSVLYNLINSRMVEGRATIISTNLEPAELESAYSQRMVSRLICGYRVLRFYGRDIRLAKRTKGAK